MKKKMKKLRLNRETLRTLEEPGLRRAGGAAFTSLFNCPLSYETNCVSICMGCTTPLDGCPDPPILT